MSGPRRFVRSPLPSKGHPIVRALYELMREERTAVLDVAERAGLSTSTIRHWKNCAQRKERKTPTIDSIDSCLRVLGYKLAIVPEEETRVVLKAPPLSI